MPRSDSVPTIGIVIPAYNEESTIRSCVLAALEPNGPRE